ncbi:hypothetical protein PFISCL1PPCAC_21828 [Pristionchus fissidentatus]|uniref:Saposin B-type domain-containing protein n=1 Tax=Pristionchus fissidentatus TaxID=1538716 RepID=A0AAV5WHZ5_9BILA|nr:hypothetical protein PFISCL1PPCAC_21828 [Pristionchus fissidentatus]
MSRFVLLFAAVLAAAAAATAYDVLSAAEVSFDDFNPQKLCKECPMLVNLLLNNQKMEEKIFGKVAIYTNSRITTSVLLCEAGLMGELTHIKDELKDGNVTPKQICQKLHICPEK